MIPISLEQNVITITIGESFKEGNGLSLHFPTAISRILIEINWRAEVKTAFFPVVGYFDKSGNVREVIYTNLNPSSFSLPIRLYNKREPDNDTFECSYVAFRLNDTGFKTDNMDIPITFNPIAYKLEDTDREWKVALERE
jgi:hypothetical protein